MAASRSLLFLVILCSWILACLSSPCQRQYFSASSFACVCNSTYCDTVEPDTRLPVGRFAVYTTSKSGQRLTRVVQYLGRTLPTEQLSVRVDTNIKKQSIIGFGGTFTDAAGMNIASLPDTAQQNLIDSYFSPVGIEYTLGRIPVASNDMSTDVYSYDFTSGDTGLSKFTIAGFDHIYKLPYIDKAVLASRRNVSLFGTPWSSPDWMKTNDNMVGYGTVLPSMRKVYANYLARFLQEYESFMFHGRMWGLTTQSSPSRGCSNLSEPVYQSMCWSVEDMRDWIINDLKPSLNDYGYGHIKLLTMDDNRGELPAWSRAFKDLAAWGAIDGFAVQWYNDTSVSPKVLSEAHAMFKDKLIVGSEACIREKPAVVLGSWERAEEIATSIFQDLQNYVSGFTHNNLAVDTEGGPSWVQNFADAPVIVNKDKGIFYKQPMFYVIGHFSKFLTPGSVAVGVLSDDVEGAATVAFLRPDGAIVVIVQNTKDTDIQLEILQDHNVINFTLEPSSIYTFIWWTN